ncbi:Protein CBG12666 [Caenorhabditis briggsae]|uniref:Protein CBG12666 n=1 Tax=Caenorhabditis briggsae TaxID=6238 RepID=A8XGA5_CAEBR|nr:Protein CBG12666 [Caenorhabditis briggsae]CAP31611.2 Protein CBG12666 [Caenorhabditis briggsae]
MTETYELKDLPAEMQRLLVGKCDLITRCRLRASSRAMNEVVATTKLFIPSVRIKQLPNDGVFIKLVIKLFKDEYTLKFKETETGGTRICQAFRSEIIVEDSQPICEAVNWFKIMCLQKNVTIGNLIIETTDNADGMGQKFGELVQNSDEILRIECDSIITGDVCSLTASVIFLKSTSLTEEMVYRLIEKFVNRREAESAFCLENPGKWNLDSFSPSGFEAVDDWGDIKYYENRLLDDKMPVVYLRVSDGSVRLEVGRNALLRTWTENGDKTIIPPPSDYDDSSEYDFYDDFDDDENGEYQYDWDPENEMLDGLYESDFDDEGDYPDDY